MAIPKFLQTEAVSCWGLMVQLPQEPGAEFWYSTRGPAQGLGPVGGGELRLSHLRNTGALMAPSLKGWPRKEIHSTQGGDRELCFQLFVLNSGRRNKAMTINATGRTDFYCNPICPWSRHRQIRYQFATCMKKRLERYRHCQTSNLANWVTNELLSGKGGKKHFLLYTLWHYKSILFPGFFFF